MNLRPIEAIYRMHCYVETGPEVGYVVQPAEEVGGVFERQTEAKHGEQASHHRAHEHGDLGNCE